MARHRSPRGRSRRTGISPLASLATDHATAGTTPQYGQCGAHRLPRPSPALRGRALTTAVAAGALAVASHSVPLSTAANAEQAPSVTPISLAPGSAIGSSPPSSTLSSSTSASALPAELVRIAPGVDPEAEVAALNRAVERVERKAALHAAQVAYDDAVRNRLGKPYQAGINNSLDGWIAQALGLLGLPQALAPGVKKIIIHESTGNPNAINNWDRNAVAGNPSQGLMQTIPATYRACVLPGLADRPITDPVANITAGLRSMITHHGIEPVINGGRQDSAGNYIGYGGHGCAGYDLSRYADRLRPMWANEPLPDADLARGVPAQRPTAE